MVIFETIKRRMVRSTKRLDRFISYSNLRQDEGPSLSVSMPSGYTVNVSFHDLAYLVRAADEFAVKEGMPKGLSNWRNLE